MAVMAKREGYLLVDHSASPGLPDNVARAAGYDPLLCREGKKFETATLTCKHCKLTMVKNMWRTRERANCYKCGCAYICDWCAIAMLQSDYDHKPFEAIYEEGLRRHQHQRPGGIIQMGGVTPMENSEPPKLILPPGYNQDNAGFEHTASPTP